METGKVYVTKGGHKATIDDYYPKVEQYTGTIRLGAIAYEALWDKEGRNLEYVEWDLDLKGEKDASSS